MAPMGGYSRDIAVPSRTHRKNLVEHTAETTKAFVIVRLAFHNYSMGLTTPIDLRYLADRWSPRHLFVSQKVMHQALHERGGALDDVLHRSKHGVSFEDGHYFVIRLVAI
jgi:hypothetical protein